jgi:outer membrane protein assembly factor BamD (BamD/ComL family)
MKIKNFIIAFVILTSYFYQVNAQIIQDIYPIGSEEFQLSFHFYNEGLLRLSEKQLVFSLENFPDAPLADKSRILEAYINMADKNYILADATLSNFLIERNNSPFVAPAAYLRACLLFENKNYEQSSKLFDKALSISNSEFKERTDSNYLNIANNSLYWKAVFFNYFREKYRSKAVF